ncbi:MAG TPA: carbonic anhydrase [Gemmatimonadales bacterium]|nr:carbonic anhydrase [Gemmatimonadales bacterium]
MEQMRNEGSVSRRAVLGSSVAAALGATLGISSWTGRFPSVAAQTNISPADALKRLMDGNARYAIGKLISFQQDLQILKQKTTEKQEPFAAVLSCADSRVPVEIVFDQTIGHVFVTRVAGNVVTPEIIGSLEYGVAVLGTAVLVVLGHGSCGAVSAAIAAKDVPGQISALYRHIRPAVDQAGSDLDAAIRANARIHARLLQEASPVIASAVKQKRLKVVAAYYDLATGVVTLLG